MTTFHSEAAKAIVADVIATWIDDWPEELETITGYSVEEYQALAERLAGMSFVLSKEDRRMLRAAAAQLFGYPGVSTQNCEGALGIDWRKSIDSMLQR